MNILNLSQLSKEQRNGIKDTPQTDTSCDVINGICPENPSYGLYTFTFYFNGPKSTVNYSSLVVKYYKKTGVTP